MIEHGLEEMALLHTPSDDGLLSVEVEQALKALGMVSNTNGRSNGDIRDAVDDLRRTESAAPTILRRHRHARDLAVAPALLAAEEDVVVL